MTKFDRLPSRTLPRNRLHRISLSRIILPRCRLILLHEHKKHSTLQCMYSVQTESHEDPIENLGHRQKDQKFLQSISNQLKQSRQETQS